MKYNTLTIEKMVNGGFGLARNHEGRIVFIPYSLPGEVVLCGGFEQRKQTLFATIKEIVQPHPGRVEPPCPYYQSCGGCNLQHCDYQTQLMVKDQILEDLLRTLFKPSSSCVPSPEFFGYRQRIRLQVQGNSFGFKRFRSSEVVAVQACLLAHYPINSVMERMLSDQRSVRLLAISEEAEFLFNPNSAKVRLLFHCLRKPRPAELTLATELVHDIEELESVYFIGHNFSRLGPYPEKSGAKYGNHLSHIFTTTSGHQPFRLSWEVGAFCQVNLSQNEYLIDHVIHCCKPEPDSRILDLFCGMGNFSIPLALMAGCLVGVEGQGASIRMARKNGVSAGLTNIEFLKDDIACACDQLIAAREKFSTIVVDPPRQGINNLYARLAQLTDNRLIYVSCDPATLVRDIPRLAEQGFEPVSLTPFDMFPQTHHMETVTVFEKSSLS